MFIVTIIDSIMGAGKSSAAIAYINSHPEKRYIIITPFIDETERFRASCPGADFRLPAKLFVRGGAAVRSRSKSESLRDLLLQGCNVAITHTLFSLVEDDTCDVIERLGYTIFIDEAVNIFKTERISAEDYEIITSSDFALNVTTDRDHELGYDVFVHNPGKEYRDGRLKPMFLYMRAHRLIGFKSTQDKRYYHAAYFLLSKRLFEIAKEVFILTYQFEGTILCSYLRINNIAFVYGGVTRTQENGKDVFSFSDTTSMPAYTKNIKRLISIVDSNSLNAIGDKIGSRHPLSKKWYEDGIANNSGDIARMRANLGNFFKHYVHCPTGDRYWGVFKDARSAISGKGYIRRFLPINARATNAYSNCTAVAFCADVYCSPEVKNYFAAYNQPMSDDVFALSMLIQFVWRSAIRNGKHIDLYLPSSRMRTLFVDWIDRISEGKER